MKRREVGVPPPMSGHLRETLKRARMLALIYGAFDQVRFITRRRAWSLRRRIFDRREIGRYLVAHTVAKLQIGAGPNPLPGWLNTDLHPDIYPDRREEIVFLDATASFPLPDMSLDYIFSEHQIEHIAEEEARAMLRECFRVLRSGGRIRIATPDLAAVVGLYQAPLGPQALHYIDWVMEKIDRKVGAETFRCYVVNQMFNAYRHRFIYDAETLTELLRDVGFVEVTRCRPGKSDDSVLTGLEAHGRAIGDEEVNRFETLVLEALRPAPAGGL
jgi:SAM-dependent methyltransferase